MSERIPLYDEENDYIDEEHIQEFARALVWEDEDEPVYHESGTVTPLIEAGVNGVAGRNGDAERNGVERNGAERNGGTERNGGVERNSSFNLSKKNSNASLYKRRPDLIVSKSDWYPLTNTDEVYKDNKRNDSKRSKMVKNLRNEFRSSASYYLLRWPILIFIIGWVLILCVLYGIVRIHVALKEYFFTWTGEQKKLRNNLRNSKTYQEWIMHAKKLDNYLRLDKWSLNPRFSYYDYRTVSLTIRTIKKLREEQNDFDLMLVLQGCLKTNFAGIENRQLYSHKYYGTKNLIQEFVDLVSESIDFISASTQITPQAKRNFFKIVLKNYGKSALVLSGGACFAYTHFGIVKALIDEDLLPSIISGTSGGGLIAAIACTRTDEELKKLLVPQLARKITACEEPWYIWLPRFWKTGARFDAVAWARKSNFFTRGSTTFQEAYERTGRKLNISTVPADPHSPVILCNSITSSNCIIWSTLLASSAVPGILNPVVLMMKNPNSGKVVPFSLGNKWRDGSLRTDIPIVALNTYYNVTFLIVSQVNPHISLFFFAPKGAVGRPVARKKISKGKYASLRGGFVATALEHLFKLEITKWLQMVKTLDLLPNFLEQDWLNIWLQKFTGSITIWPRYKLKDFWYILSDPTEEQLGEMILKGERCMYPRLLFIKNRLKIERAIERGRKSTKLSNKVLDSSSNGHQVFDDFQIHNVNFDDTDDDRYTSGSQMEPKIENEIDEYFSDDSSSSVNEDGEEDFDNEINE